MEQILVHIFGSILLAYPLIASHACPCVFDGTSLMQQVPPTFIDNNYYCESSN